MFWFNGWTVYLMKGVSNMAIKKYIGARYAPQFMGAWDKASEYAALSVVYTNDQSYVSRKTVPANTEITNTEFWIKSAEWNAQVTQYKQNVERYQANVERYNQNVETYTQAVDQFYADTLHSYDTKADMVADRSLKLGDTLLTCGNEAISDGGGSFYQVVPETSAKAVALENGLFALPFEFQPYDYSEFQGEVDRVVASFNQNTQQLNQKFGTSVAEIKNASLNNYNTEADMISDLTLEANRTVLTSGKAQIGDNLGSFYRIQNTSARDDAVNLSNGKKAVPFQIQGGIASGSQLNYLGQSNVPAVWNAISPTTITIPITLTGDTATVFAAILFKNGSSTTNIQLKVGSDIRTITISDSGTPTYDKCNLYALNIKKINNIYYWSYSLAASWNITYAHDTITGTATFPASLQPVNTGVSASALSYSKAQSLGLCAITVNKRIRVDSITLNFGQEAPGGLDAINRSINFATSDASGYNLAGWTNENLNSAQPSGTVTYTILSNKAVLEPNKTYYIQVADYLATTDTWYITGSVTPSSAQGPITMLPAGTAWDISGAVIEHFVTSNRVSIQFNYTEL